MAIGITLNQTLHGYADGHQLLASSVDLTSEQQALLLVMSDLSGPAFRSGFDSYLTGYPLQNLNQYCFAQTWFAPELPRPGCVWTHTFLIRNEDLARIKNLEILERLFRRPNTLDDARRYEDRPFFREELSEDGKYAFEDGRPVLAALYGTNRKIVVPSDSSRVYEAMVLRIYDQQWPRLRRSFRFCTGALSWRESEFDLSVCPPEETHSIGGSGLVVEEGPERSFDDWVEVAMRDLAGSAVSDYRRFLWQFGSDYANGRAAFRPLTEVYQILNAPSDSEAIGEKVLSAIAHFFPEARDSRRLKGELFGREGGYLSNLGGDAAVTKILVTHPAATALDADIAAIRRRSIDLAESDIHAATNLALLAAQLGGVNAQVYLDGYFDHALKSDDVLRQAPSSLVFDILERQPALLGNRVIWTRLDHAGLVNRAVAMLSADPMLLTDAVSAMLAAQAWDAVTGVVEQFAAPALKRIFEFIDREDREQIDFPDRLYSIIWSRPAVVAQMLERNEIGAISLKMLTAEIDPRSWHLRRVGLGPWLRVVKTGIPFDHPKRALNSAVFLLSVGLSFEGNGSASLVAASFGAVYEAAKADALDSVLWERLEPSLSWYAPTWDKCARLIRTVARAFKDRDWPPAYFPRTFGTNEQFERALADLDETWRGNYYIRRLRDAGDDGELSWSAEQVAVFKGFT